MLATQGPVLLTWGPGVYVTLSHYGHGRREVLPRYTIQTSIIVVEIGCCKKPNQIPELIKSPIGDIEDTPIEETKVSILVLEKGVH